MSIRVGILESWDCYATETLANAWGTQVSFNALSFQDLTTPRLPTSLPAPARLQRPSPAAAMETPSQPTLSRMALGALDVNKHLNSPHASPRKSPSKKNTFVFDDASERPVTYSLKEQVLEASLPPSRPTSPLRVSSVSPSRNEKRKIASTSLLGDAEEAVRHAKHARVEERERTAVGHGHVLGKDAEREVVGAAGPLRQRDADEEAQVSYAVLIALGQRAYKTYQSSHETAPPQSPNSPFDTSVVQDDSQLTNITEPDAGLQSPGVPSPTVSELREVSTGRSNPPWENYYSRNI